MQLGERIQNIIAKFYLASHKDEFYLKLEFLFFQIVCPQVSLIFLFSKELAKVGQKGANVDCLLQDGIFEIADWTFEKLPVLDPLVEPLCKRWENQ